MPSVEVVVLNWNGIDDTRRCIASLRAQTHRDFGVTVVDNGSAADEGARLERELAGAAAVVRSATNLGFTGGCNLAIERVLPDPRVRWIALLNNDAEAEPEWLERLVAAAAAHPDAGLVASRMVFRDAPDVIENTGIEVLWTGDAVPRGRGRPRLEFDADGPVLGACGGAMLVRADVLRAIGAFRGDFFANFEDVDLSLRALACGYGCWYCADAVVHHGLGRSIARVRGLAFDVRSVRNLTWAWAVNLPQAALLATLPALLLHTALLPLLSLVLLRPRLGLVLLLGRGRALRELSAILRARRELRPRRRAGSWHVLRLLRSPLTAGGAVLVRQFWRRGRAVRPVR
jgi:hypothetical protein